ncbi:MAG: hypothetical protein ABSD74_12410 [Rhizomicrobium sp.]|jgi:hypothetical protein
MIFSKQHDFLFIKGRKIAGTSVEMALSTICGPDDIITRITPIDELERLKRGGKGAQNYSRDRAEERTYIEKLLREADDLEAIEQIRPPRAIYKNHISLKEFVDSYGSLPTGRIFGVERSPYAKIISRAVMAVKFSRYRRTGEDMSLSPRRIVSIVESQMGRGDIETCKNIDLYRGPDGKIPVRVLRQEALAEEFAKLMDEYGISPVPELPHAKKGINSNTVDPKSVFTREQLDRINAVFAEEFDAFGYERL